MFSVEQTTHLSIILDRVFCIRGTSSYTYEFMLITRSKCFPDIAELKSTSWSVFWPARQVCGSTFLLVIKLFRPDIFPLGIFMFYSVSSTAAGVHQGGDLYMHIGLIFAFVAPRSSNEKPTRTKKT
jgi:hypothetical protein